MKRALPVSLVSSLLLVFVFCIAVKKTTKEDPVETAQKQKDLESHAASSNDLKGAPLSSHLPLENRSGDQSAVDERTSIAEFADWQKKWTATEPASAAPALVAEGLKIAKKRRQELYQLMAEDPEDFVKAALSEHERSGLPSQIVQQLPSFVEGRGDLEWLAAAPEPGEAPPERSMYRTASLNGQEYDAYVYGRRREAFTSLEIPMRGLAIDDRVVILESSARPLNPDEKIAVTQSDDLVELAMEEHIAVLPDSENPLLMYGNQPIRVCCQEHAALVGNVPESEWPTAAWDGETSASDAPTAASSWTEGTKKALAILVDFPDLTGPPETNGGTVLDATYITNRMNNEVHYFYDETSFGKTGFSTMTSADVTPVLRMPQNAQTYAENSDNGGLRVDSSALAEAAGYNLENYDRIFLLFKKIGTSRYPASQITYGGLGQIGNKFMWMHGSFGLGLCSHELGHTYGLGHASRWEPSNSDPIDPNGSLIEYGDVFDEMGSGTSSHPLHPSTFNPRYLNKLDWLPDAAIQDVSSGGTFRVYRFDHKNANLSQTRALTINRDQNYTYWIGYRRKYLGDASKSDIAMGAYIFRVAPDGTGKTELLDLDTPGSNPNDASLNVGNSFDDAAGGIEITVDAAGGSGSGEYLDVTIDFDPRIQITTPTLDVDEQGGSANLVLSRTGNGSGSVTVNWSTTSGTAVSPADYTASSNSVTWANGDMADKTISVPLVADAVTEGSENFSIQLTGITGGVLVGQTSATVNIVEPGAIDSSFSTLWFNNSGSVHQFAVQPDGKIAFVGRAGGFGGENVGGIGRLFADGSKDQEFFDQGEGANVTAVRSIARQPDGKLVIGGNFTTVRGIAATRVARLNVDGTLDTGFNPGTGPNGVVRGIAVQPDGKIVIGGNFSTVNGVARQSVARLNSDGSLDTGFFVSSPTGTNTIDVETLALQPDGKILIGGSIYANFNSIFSNFSSGIWRLDSDGSIDMSFDVGSGAHAAGSTGSLRRVYAIAVQPDGKVILGGNFTGFDGVNQPRLVRLSSTGSVDSSFQSSLGLGPDDDVRSLLLQNDGKLLVGGQFKNFSGNSILYAARVSSGGAFDGTFNAGLNEIVPGGTYGNWVRSFSLQPDGKVLIAQEIWGDQQRVIARVFTGIPGLPGKVEFTGGTFSDPEGSSAQVTVKRTGGSTGAVQVAYSTVGGTATEGGDYTKTQGFLTWADGDSADKVISIPLTSDATVEPAESFSVQLSVPVGGVSIGNQSIAQVSILSAPGIEIEQPAGTSLTNSVSQIDFGNVAVNQTAQRTFTIRNSGTSTLSGLALSIDGSNLIFPPGTLSTTTLAANESTTFTVGFAPQQAGPNTATLHIDSNDPNNSRFSVGLSGNGLTPEIVVEEPAFNNLVDGNSTRNFGSLQIGNSVTKDFTIRNTGEAVLSGLSASFAGTSPGSFSASAFGSTSLSQNESTVVTITFTPSAAGAQNAILRIASNDSDENPFDINLTGIGAASEIRVEEPLNVSLTDGLTTNDFGHVHISQNLVKTFTIRNVGTQPLTGLGLTVDGTNTGDFVAANLTATSLASNATATFTVTFSPSSDGSRSATLHISSNDIDENPFDINLTGTGASPEIEVEQPVSVPLIDGTSSIDFGPETEGQAEVKSFTIRNSGTTSLLGLGVTFSGTHAADFSSGSIPASIPPGQSATVDITFNPNGLGARSASMSIASNDSDENPFDIDLTGSGVTGEIVVEEPLNNALVDGVAAVNYGEVAEGVQDTKTFTIRNTGTGDLFGLSLSVGGSDASQFIASALGETSLGPGESTTFTVTFQPTGGGQRTAALQVASNDADENPFDVSLQGTAIDRMKLSEWAGSYGLSGSAALPSADNDRDGMTLLTEYAFNMNPTVADYATITPSGSETKGLPSIRVVAGQLEIQYLRRRNDPNLEYEPQFGNELSDNTFQQASGGIVVSPINDAFERCTVIDSETTVTQPLRFGRVQVMLDNP